MPSPLPHPPISLDSIAAHTPGATVHGNGAILVSDLAHPRMITDSSQLVLILDQATLSLLQQSPISIQAAVVAPELDIPEGWLAGYIRVERPRFAMAALLNIFDKPLHAYTGVHPTAVIESSAQLGEQVSVGAFVYVGEHAVIGDQSILLPHVTIGAQAQLGKACILHPGARVGERVILGNRVILHHNASIGADGFSYVTPEPGNVESAKASGGKVTGQNSEIFKINSIGTVMLGDDVEVGACTTIDRSNLGATVIKKGTKIDNLVMIGHNNTVGENCLIVSQVGVAGSCEIGDRVVIAGQAGLGDHLKVGNDAIIMAKSGVMRDIEAKEVVIGIPAQPRREALQNILYMGKLRDMFQEIKALKKRVAQLESESHPLPGGTTRNEVEV